MLSDSAFITVAMYYVWAAFGAVVLAFVLSYWNSRRLDAAWESFPCCDECKTKSRRRGRQPPTFPEFARLYGADLGCGKCEVEKHKKRI